MGRIRTIKPEFWTSEQIVECSTNARLLFIGLWNFCDDGGVHPASAKRLKMEVFPGDSISETQINWMVDELISSGLVRLFTHNGESFWFVNGWRHQKIDKPSYKYPGPLNPDFKGVEFAYHSPNGSRTLADHSPPEGKVRESKVKEGNGKEEVCTETPSVSVPPVPLLTFPTDGNPKQWHFCQGLLDTLATAYPHLDVMAETNQAFAWIATNPERQKTARGMPAFLNRWMTKAQNLSRSSRNANRYKPLTVADIFGDDA